MWTDFLECYGRGVTVMTRSLKKPNETAQQAQALVYLFAGVTPSQVRPEAATFVIVVE